jgi:hypothetical protein
VRLPPPPPGALVVGSGSGVVPGISGSLVGVPSITGSDTLPGVAVAVALPLPVFGSMGAGAGIPLGLPCCPFSFSSLMVRVSAVPVAAVVPSDRLTSADVCSGEAAPVSIKLRSKLRMPANPPVPLVSTSAKIVTNTISL